MPPIASTGQPSVMESLASNGASAGGGSPQQGDPSAALQQLISKLRQYDEQTQSLSAELPMLGQETQQIRQLIRKMMVKAAQMGNQQGSSTPSSDALPGGGM
jgi:hypothetical protein